MKISAIVLAAGRGRRFFLLLDKQHCLSKVFEPLQGRPMFLRSLGVLSKIADIKEIILVVPRELISLVQRRFLSKFRFGKPVRLVAGGEERVDSSYAGFKKVKRSATHVLIHDAARPLLSEEALKKLLRVAAKSDGTILARPVVPTLKSVDENLKIKATVSREKLWEAETPQVFKKSILEKAFRNYWKNPFPVTDDASLCEHMGVRITVTENKTPNLKITSPLDLKVAENMLGNGQSFRWGIGYDIHRLALKRKLKLGGITVSSKKGALGHSDGDTLLHAVIDACLGASGLGDIGEWFPDHDSRYKGAASSKMLKKVFTEIFKRGYKPVQVDTTIHLEKPKLMKYKDRMRKNIARLLKIQPNQVNIKAKTSEGLGAVGKGKAVAVEAIVCLEANRG